MFRCSNSAVHISHSMWKQQNAYWMFVDSILFWNLLEWNCGHNALCDSLAPRSVCVCEHLAVANHRHRHAVWPLKSCVSWACGAYAVHSMTLMSVNFNFRHFQIWFRCEETTKNCLLISAHRSATITATIINNTAHNCTLYVQYVNRLITYVNELVRCALKWNEFLLLCELVWRRRNSTKLLLMSEEVNVVTRWFSILSQMCDF